MRYLKSLRNTSFALLAIIILVGSPYELSAEFPEGLDGVTGDTVRGIRVAGRTGADEQLAPHPRHSGLAPHSIR